MHPFRTISVTKACLYLVGATSLRQRRGPLTSNVNQSENRMASALRPPGLALTQEPA